MDWWEDFGVLLQFLPDTPALAFDMSANGPQDQAFKYSLAYNMQNTATPIEVYPPEGMTFPGEE